MAFKKKKPDPPHNLTRRRRSAQRQLVERRRIFPIMSMSAFASWSPFKKLIVISSKGSVKVADRSPFKIHRELKSILGRRDHQGHRTWSW
ncbi:hypothetical protein PoB_005927600 [Plakobranchus ocellatus]|uniref:Uncharacterized protein n=1 Tax=Plakobranchus ocellatus TaxID=259542 RepID=A0AAV4CBT4_9GAST|nr:hypothetical protein PoB_005927600 [Plakobranchus ocellatus]